MPYSIYCQIVDGLYTRFRRDNQSKVFEAIFNSQIDLDAPVLGIQSYKHEVWINDGYDVANDSQWSIYPPDYNYNEDLQK